MGPYHDHVYYYSVVLYIFSKALNMTRLESKTSIGKRRLFFAGAVAR